ncbi:MAG: glycosyltransferase [Xanthobacteraceae bacterium]|nr:glycosyltransferase [Xanthobacteraceae bacterium]
MPVPLVSVIMPARNAGRFLDSAIRSVLDQSLPDFELLVVDDGSDDDTRAICQHLARSDARVMVSTNPGRGLVDALNHGLHSARGRYVARMDADDISLPGRFKRQVDLLDANPGIAVVGSWADIIDEAGATLGAMTPPTDPEAVRIELMHRSCIVHPSAMIRAETIRRVGGYRRAFIGCEDYDLWLRISEVAGLANLGEVLLLYRMHDEQVTWARTEQRILSELAAVACATRRRSGLGDVVSDQTTAIDRALLIGIGIPEAEIDRQLRQRLVGTAIDAARYGRTRSARAALALALQRPDLPLKMRLRCWFLMMMTALSFRGAPKARARNL